MDDFGIPSSPSEEIIHRLPKPWEINAPPATADFKFHNPPLPDDLNIKIPQNREILTKDELKAIRAARKAQGDSYRLYGRPTPPSNRREKTPASSKSDILTGSVRSIETIDEARSADQDDVKKLEGDRPGDLTLRRRTGDQFQQSRSKAPEPKQQQEILLPEAQVLGSALEYTGKVSRKRLAAEDLDETNHDDACASSSGIKKRPKTAP